MGVHWIAGLVDWHCYSSATISSTDIATDGSQGGAAFLRVRMQAYESEAMCFDVSFRKLGMGTPTGLKQRQRTAALQDAPAFSEARPFSDRSWSAAVLCRFHTRSLSLVKPHLRSSLGQEAVSSDLAELFAQDDLLDRDREAVVVLFEGKSDFLEQWFIG
jgi:hypothetical protein